MTFRRLHSAQSVNLKDDGHAITGDDRSRAASAARWPAHLGAVDRAASSRSARNGAGILRANYERREGFQPRRVRRTRIMRRRTRVGNRGLVGGESQLPGNFPERLLGLKERAGLTWEAMAFVLGVDSRQLLRWRRGTAPNGGAMLSLVRFAAQVPGGLAELIGDEPIVNQPPIE